MSIKQSLNQINLWINNDDVIADRYVEVRDPGRLTDVIGMVAQGTPQHVDQAVRAAHQAFLSWRDISVEERGRLLLKCAEILEGDIEKYASILTREVGIVHSQSIWEMYGAIFCLRGAAELAEDFFKPEVMEDEQSLISIEKVPLGVVTAIIPWNVPLAIAMSKIAPILVTGNTVVIKPSPHATMAVSMALKEMSVLFPPGVINIVHGGAEVGDALTSHPLVRKITLTGGDKTAKNIMKSAANSLKRLHFELGGNDPAILLDDVQLEKVVPEIVQMAFTRSGQICVATKRVYIPENKFSQACEIFIKHINEFKIGHGLNENATFGPVNNKLQYTRVKELIERVKEQSTVLELGEKLEPENWHNGYYIQPAVVINAKPEQEIVTCEQFGPIIPLVSYRNEKELIQMVNNTEYGLGSSVWTSDYERGFSFARNIEAGMTGINGSIDSPLGFNNVPFGGVKQSGFGWERGRSGLNEYVNYHGITYHKNK